MPRDDDLPLRRIALVGGALATVVVIAVLAVGLLLHTGSLPWRIERNRLPAGFQRPAPSVQADQPAERAALLARQQRRLESFGWTDPVHGWVHVPIDVAIAQSAASEPAR